MAQFTAQLGSLGGGGMPDWRLIPMEDGRTMQKAVKRPEYIQDVSNDTSGCGNGYVGEWILMILIIIEISYFNWECYVV